MARTKRLLCDYGIYHLLNRGHNKQVLFKHDLDFKKFLFIIMHYVHKYEIQVYNYCIMPNHFHLLVKIGASCNLSRAMKSICQSYAHFHKKKYNRVGYLFQNRYKSIPVERDEYLLECARYIERNPLRAGLISDLSEYPWSSYHFYAHVKEDNLITSNPMYYTFGLTPQKARWEYKKYLLSTRPYELLLDNIIDKMF